MSSSAGGEPLRPAAPRVVIADDDAVFRSGVRAALQDAGIVVIAEADNGRDAIDLAVHFRPDVVLMDVVMVGMDGISATRAIAGRAPEVSVVLLTSSQDAELGMIGLRAGADGHLVKGLAFDELVAAVRTAADGEPVLAPAVARRLIERLRALPDGGLGVRPVRSTLTSREWEVLDLLCARAHGRRRGRPPRAGARHRAHARQAHPAQARRALAGRGDRDGQRDPRDLRAGPPRAARRVAAQGIASARRCSGDVTDDPASCP